MKIYIYVGIFLEYHLLLYIKERCHALFPYDSAKTAYNILYFI